MFKKCRRRSRRSSVRTVNDTESQAGTAQPPAPDDVPPDSGEPPSILVTPSQDITCHKLQVTPVNTVKVPAMPLDQRPPEYRQASR
jgi:hypothetical protein